MRQARNNQSGVMLLEVLVALLIFAIGILGLVGMQAVSIKLTADSKYRAEAGMYADQLINQMWADNLTNAMLVANYDSTVGGGKYTAWKSQIQGTGTGLPGASGANDPTVAIDINNVVTVSIFWQAPEETAAHKYVTVARLNPP
jgi:type IV pilus assembly protein PilV